MIPIRLKLKPDDTSYYREDDVRRITQAFANNGMFCSMEQAEWLWESYSDSMCAGWIFIPEDDDEIISCCRPFFEEAKYD